MILHLGGDYFVKTKEILVILDYEEAARNKDTSLFLKGLETNMERKKRICRRFRRAHCCGGATGRGTLFCGKTRRDKFGQKKEG